NFIGEPTCVAFPRKYMAHGFDAGFHHLGDLDYWLRILLNGDFTYTHQELCSFRRHRKSQTHLNLSELRVATDLLRIGRKFRSVLVAAGLSEREFMRAALKLISEQLYCLTRSDEGDFAVGRTDRWLGDQGAPDDGLYLQRARRLLSTLSAEELRDLTSYALELLVEENKLNSTRQPQQVTREEWNETLIARYESKLRRVLDDPCWKATALLRVAKKYLTESAPSSRARHDEPSNGKPGSQQEEYIECLKSQICRVKSSRSWALGRFLKEPDFRPGSLTALAGRLLGRRSLQREIRELNRTKKGPGVKPRVSWQPVDSLIREVIYDFQSPRRTAQLDADTGVGWFEGGLDVNACEEQQPQISLLLSVEREEPTVILEALAR